MNNELNIEKLVKLFDLIPKEVLEEQQNGNVVFFVGAGVSKHKADLPLFKDLLLEVLSDENIIAPKHKRYYSTCDDANNDCKKLNLKKEYKYKELSSIFHELLIDYNRDIIDDKIKSILKDKTNKKLKEYKKYKRENPLSYHKNIVDISRNKNNKIQIITTNFDELFIEATKESEKDTKIYYSYDIPLNIGDFKDKGGIVHLHNTIEDIEGFREHNIIYSTEDYSKNYISEHSKVRNFLFQILKNYTVVFIGYSLNDLIISYILQASDKRKKHYIFLNDKIDGKTPPNNIIKIKLDENATDSYHNELYNIIEIWANFNRLTNFKDIAKLLIEILHTKNPIRYIMSQQGRIAEIKGERINEKFILIIKYIIDKLDKILENESIYFIELAKIIKKITVDALNLANINAWLKALYKYDISYYNKLYLFLTKYNLMRNEKEVKEKLFKKLNNSKDNNEDNNNAIYKNIAAIICQEKNIINKAKEEARELEKQTDKEIKNIFINFKKETNKDNNSSPKILMSYKEYQFINLYTPRSISIISNIVKEKGIFNKEFLDIFFYILQKKESYNINVEKISLLPEIVSNTIKHLDGLKLKYEEDYSLIESIINLLDCNTLKEDNIIQSSIENIKKIYNILSKNSQSIDERNDNQELFSLLTNSLCRLFMNTGRKYFSEQVSGFIRSFNKDKIDYYKTIFNNNIDFFKSITEEKDEKIRNGSLIGLIRNIDILIILNEEFVKDNLIKYFNYSKYNKLSEKLWEELFINESQFHINIIDFILNNDEFFKYLLRLTDYIPINYIAKNFMSFMPIFITNLLISSLQNYKYKTKIDDCKLLIEDLSSNGYQNIFKNVKALKDVNGVEFLKTYIFIQKKYNTLEIISTYLAIGYKQERLKEVYDFLEKRKILSKNRKLTFDNKSRFLDIILDSDYSDYIIKQDLKSISEILKEINQTDAEVLIKFKNNYLDEQSLKKHEIASLFFSKLEEIKNNK